MMENALIDQIIIDVNAKKDMREGIARWIQFNEVYFSYVFLQISVPVDKFDRTDLVDKENCKKQGCEQKSGNAKCDPECNLVACNFDGKLTNIL